MDGMIAVAPRRSTEANTKTINLALQGGGAHGAFAWGVLDRLLEDGRVGFEGISATSAGAMNAAVLASGLSLGGREGGRQALETFWKRISEAGRYSPVQLTPLDQLMGNMDLSLSPSYVFFDILTRMMSPYQLNPGNFNPLREVLEATVDFERIHRACAVRLYLCATNVRTGKVKIFENAEITSDAVLASGCLPFMFQAVEIDGEAYWDGGYMGNPAIFPLIYGCRSRDVVVVHINPLERPEIPKTASEIMNRINEISFNSSLMREMRAIAFVTRLIDDKKVDGELSRMLIHDIAADEVMAGLGVASKLNPDWGFLCQLRDLGRKRAALWLDEHFAALGERSTTDIRSKYL